ncbi:MAG: tetratricopeptide repeat protein [Bacteroidota bacterium]
MKISTIITAFCLAICFSTTNIFAQEAHHDKAIQQFYTAYMTNSVPAWKISLGQLEKHTDDASLLLLAKGYYAASGTAMGNQDKDLAGEMLEKAEAVNKAILAKDKKSPEANALMSSIYGMKIGLSPMKGMFLGSKSSAAAEKGVTLDPENAFTNYVKGNYLFYTPSMFGGDVEESITFLKKAQQLFEQTGTTQTWEYLATMAVLGQAYHSEEKYDEAIATYETALAVAPNFGYVGKYLLPMTKKAVK